MLRSIQAVIFFMILGFGSLWSYARQTEKPNILLIFSDDQGYNDVGCYGSEIPTPNIDSIARQGIKFTDWYVAAPVCTPSRFALLTGQYPNRSQDKMLGALMTLRHEDKGIRPHETTIAQVLQKQGYRTGLIGKWHLGHGKPEFYPTRHGFDYFYGHTGGCVDYFKLTYAYKPNWFRNEQLIEEKGYATDLLTNEAVKFIGDQEPNKPFFLYLAYNAPHYGKGWNPEKKKLLNILQAKKEDIARFSHIENKKRREFAAMVACMDDGIGKVLKALEEKKLDENTLVVFMTDNGGTMSHGGRNTPLRSGKGSAFEGGLRVPCVMKWPGNIKAGTVTDQPGSALDIFPTLCRLTGADASMYKVDGIDLTPVLLKGHKVDRVLFWQTFRNESAYRKGQWKYIKDAKGNEYLFNLKEDISEKNNLADKYPRMLQELKAAHAVVWADTGN